MPADYSMAVDEMIGLDVRNWTVESRVGPGYDRPPASGMRWPS